MRATGCLRGVELLNNAVKVTLGPKGRNVNDQQVLTARHASPRMASLSPRKSSLPTSTRIWRTDRARSGYQEPMNWPGDGTTTATVLAASILREGASWLPLA